MAKTINRFNPLVHEQLRELTVKMATLRACIEMVSEEADAISERPINDRHNMKNLKTELDEFEKIFNRIRKTVDKIDKQISK